MVYWFDDSFNQMRTKRKKNDAKDAEKMLHRLMIDIAFKPQILNDNRLQSLFNICCKPMKDKRIDGGKSI